MAKLTIKKMRIIFLQKDSRRILGELQRLGVTELSPVKDDRLDTMSVRSRVVAYERNLRVAEEALEILERYSPSAGGIGAMFSGRRELTPEEYDRMAQNTDTVLKYADDVCGCSRTIADSRSEIAKCDTSLSLLAMWEGLDIPMQKNKTARCHIYTGLFPEETDADSISARINEKVPDSAFDVTVLSNAAGQTAASIIVYRDDSEAVYTAIRELGFAKPADPTKHPPAVRRDRLKARIAELQTIIADGEKEIFSLAEHKDEIRFLHDHLTAKRDEYTELEKLGAGNTVMVCEGYVPEKYIPSAEAILADYTAVCEFDDPAEDDDVPVVMENGSFTQPMESVIEMYSMPGKKDIDPSAIMAFFYYFLFGMMLSDAGYGILMTVFCAVMLKRSTVEGSMRKMLKMFFWSGISTTIWGLLFGSFFGDIIPVIYTQFLGLPAPDIALWFVPIENTLKLLVFSLGVGIAHLLLGLVANIYMKHKEGDLIGGLLDNVPVILLVLGVAPFGGSIFVDVPKIAVNVGLYVAIVGVVGIILFSSRESKSIIGRLGGGLYALYNNVSGYLSDILSYSRLLALGLATGSIAEVINMMGTLPENKIAKAVLLVVVFVLGHSLNMAINLLGAYVHTVRLQFVELLPKFYEGGGRAMKPFAMNTKYFKIKNNTKITKSGKGKSVGENKAG